MKTPNDFKTVKKITSQEIQKVLTISRTLLSFQMHLKYSRTLNMLLKLTKNQMVLKQSKKINKKRFKSKIINIKNKNIWVLNRFCCLWKNERLGTFHMKVEDILSHLKDSSLMFF